MIFVNYASYDYEPPILDRDINRSYDRTVGGNLSQLLVLALGPCVLKGLPTYHRLLLDSALHRTTPHRTRTAPHCTAPISAVQVPYRTNSAHCPHRTRPTVRCVRCDCQSLAPARSNCQAKFGEFVLSTDDSDELTTGAQSEFVLDPYRLVALCLKLERGFEAETMGT